MATDASRRCLPQMNACAARVASLDSDGTTQVGSTTAYATPALVTLGITPVYEAGAEIKEKDACGATFVAVTADPSLLRYDIDLDVWSTDPTFLNIVLPGGDVLTAAGGEIGFAYPAPGIVTGQFSLEFWQKIIENNTLDLDFPYAHWALPLLKNVQLQKRDVNGTGVSHTVLKAEAYVNDNWFNGPGDDWALASNKPVQWIPVAALPTMTCAPITISS